MLLFVIMNLYYWIWQIVLIRQIMVRHIVVRQIVVIWWVLIKLNGLFGVRLGHFLIIMVLFVSYYLIWY